MSRSDISIKFNSPGFDLEVNFPLRPQGITGLFGPSGSGKTTLVRCLAGLERQSRAHIQVGGNIWQSEDIFLAPHKRRVGLVFQNVRLFNHLNVRNNLLFGYKRTAEQDRKINMSDVLDILDLELLLDRHPEKLSGGEAQRVAIGRALLTSPSLMLMDEPLAALGDQHKKDILPYLKKLPESFGIPLLYVSHDFEEMAGLAQYMICLKDGKVDAAGDVLKVASGLPGVMERWAPDNIIEGETAHPGRFRLSDGQSIAVPEGTSPPRITINARDICLLKHPPEDHAGEAILKGKISNVSIICDGKSIVTIALSGQEIIVLLGRRGRLKKWISPGNDVYMMISRIKSEPEYVS